MRKERENPEILLKKLEAKERSARMRCIMFYIPPVVLALILLWYIGQSFMTQEENITDISRELNIVHITTQKDMNKELNTLNIIEQAGPVEYPLYCILEPYNEDGGEETIVDLFIINLTGRTYDDRDLEILTKTLGPKKDVEISPKIQLGIKTGLPGEIIKVDHDEIFNEGKGEVDTNQIDERHWEISVKRIEGKGILRLKIITTVEQPAISRNAKALVPLNIYYPGR